MDKLLGVKSRDKLLGVRVGTSYLELEWDKLLGVRVWTSYLELESGQVTWS